MIKENNKNLQFFKLEYYCKLMLFIGKYYSFENKKNTDGKKMSACLVLFTAFIQPMHQDFHPHLVRLLFISMLIVHPHS